MMQEVIHFLLQVVASVCGILLGAWLARVWEEYWRNKKWRKKR